MTLRILFTLAILTGLAAAPGAEQFHWEAGPGTDHSPGRLPHDIDRIVERVTLMAERVSRSVEHAADRLAWSVDRQAARVQSRVEAHVERQVRSVTQREVRAAGRGGWVTQSAIGDNPCADSDRSNDDGFRHCEVREERLPAGPLAVDAGQNGGIRVEGWDGNDILIRAVVQANARDEAQAKQIAGQVQVRTGSGQVSATGPDRQNREWWSVSYRISVPHRTDLDLNASNGGITIASVAGAITFDTTNGGVRLADLVGPRDGPHQEWRRHRDARRHAVGRRRPGRRDVERRRHPVDSHALQRAARDAHGERRLPLRLSADAVGRAVAAPRHLHHPGQRRRPGPGPHHQRRPAAAEGGRGTGSSGLERGLGLGS